MLNISRYGEVIKPRNGSKATAIMSRHEDMKKVDRIRLKIKQVKFNLSSNDNNKIKQEFPQNSFESWNEVHDFLKAKSNKSIQN